MEITGWGTTVCGVLVAMGGWESVKYLLNRKANKKKQEAEADVAETKADTDEFHLLKEQLGFCQQQLIEKEARFAEQTDLVRKLYQKIFEQAKKIGELEIAKAHAEAWRCEKGKCEVRRPPQPGLANMEYNS
jgi:hypothetical protein